jgi:hypothetical protein
VSAIAVSARGNVLSFCCDRRREATGADKTLAPPARLCAMSNPVVFMDITIGGAAAGRLTFEVRE